MTELIKRAQGGDAAAIEAAWDHVRAFAYRVAGRYYASHADAEDFMQASYLAFRAALSAYTGGNFLSLLVWKIQNECRMLIGIRSGREVPLSFVSYDALAPDAETPFVELLEDETLPDMDELLVTGDVVRDVRAAVDALPERERQVVSAHWFQDQSLRDIGASLSVSPERVRRIELRAFDHLRENRALRAYFEDVGAFHSGLSSFRRRGSSSTEAEALRRITRQQRVYDACLAACVQQVADGLFTAEEAENLLAIKRQRLGLSF